MGNVNIINHPLVKHKITLMRDEKTGTGEIKYTTSHHFLLFYKTTRKPRIYVI